MRFLWKVLLGFGLKLCIFIVLLAVLYGGFREMISARQWTMHTHRVIEAANGALIDLLSIETGVRGFASTGREGFLDPLEREKDDLGQSLDEIALLTRDNPVQQENIGQLRWQVQEWLDATVRPVQLLRREAEVGAGPPRSASSLGASETGTRLMGEMRDTVDRIRSEEERLLAERERTLGQREGTVMRWLWYGGSVGVAAGILVSVLTATLVTRPLSRTVAYARKVAAGDYAASLDLRRSDEIGALVDALRSMVATLVRQIETLGSQRTRLATMARELREANRELRDFAHVASHDLQEPLRKIRAFGDLLRLEAGPCASPKGLDYLGRMQRAAERMQRLIEGILGYSRVLRRADVLKKVDLARVAASVMEDLDARVAETDASVEIGSLPTIEADPAQMAQLLQNLIVNSLKYRRPGVRPVVRLHGGPADAPGMIEVVVEDNGIGFDERFLDKIFMPFQRLHGRSEYEGTGIGLAICRRIVERHGGFITARSEPGKGSAFIVTLPVLQPRPSDGLEHDEASGMRLAEADALLNHPTARAEGPAQRFHEEQR